MNMLRKGFVALALIASLALPSGVFAASSGVTTESGISGPSVTISLVVPATATYSLNPPDWTADEALTLINTNNPTGLTVSATVDPYVSGPTTVPTTTRRTVNSNPTGGAGLTKGADIAAGGFTNAATSKTIASSTVPVTNSAITVSMLVASASFTVPGSYTSAVHWTATANP